jgi:hypothetical protein
LSKTNAGKDKKDWELWRRSMEIAGQFPESLADAQIMMGYLQRHLDDFYARESSAAPATEQSASNSDQPPRKGAVQLLREKILE